MAFLGASNSLVELRRNQRSAGVELFDAFDARGGVGVGELAFGLRG